MFEFLKKLLYGEPKTRARTYKFPLPYKMEPSNVFLGVALLKKEGIFDKLPSDLQTKMMRAKEKWYPLRISESDLNRIDDKTWGYISTKLKLNWEYKV